MKRSFSVLFIMILLLNVSLPFVSAADNVLTPLEREVVAQLGSSAIKGLKEQRRAVAAFDVLCKHFTTEEGSVEFPDTYAGEYIIDGVLHIYLTDTSEDTLSQYRSILSGYKSVVTYEKRKYSYSYLKSLQVDIGEQFAAQGVSSVGIDSQNNCVVVNVEEESLETVRSTYTLVRRNSEEPVQFACAPKPVPASNAYGGMQLYLNNIENRILAATGFFNGQPAILTCGHNNMAPIPVNTLLKDSTGTLVGTVATSRFHNNMHGDYAICYLNTNDYNASGQVLLPSNVMSYFEGGKLNIADGTVLIKNGANGFAICTVTDRDYTANYSNSSTTVTVPGLIYCSLSSGIAKGGDSGGPMIYEDPAGPLFAGIVSGAAKDENNNYYLCFSPYSLVDGVFSLDFEAN